MSNADDEFRPKLGRIGNRRIRKPPGYLRQIKQVANKVAAGRSGRSSGFTGARMGRGYAQGRVSATRRAVAGNRRVVIKTRLVRCKPGDPGASRAHLRYVQRDGVTREGLPGELYDARTDIADGKAFVERSDGDRHQFRLIVSAEDGGDLADLKPFVRDLIRQMEADLGTRLDWVAVDHFNTGHPHTHVVVRGKDERGKDLVIAPDYIAHGMRARASDLVTRELGPETELEIVRKLEREVEAERLTRIDRAILREAPDGVLSVSTRSVRDPAHRAIRMGRLRGLEQMGLAMEAGPGVWRLAPQMEQTLRRMGERGDIIKIMHRDLVAASIERGAGNHVIFDAGVPNARVVGRVVSDGFSDELRERGYVIVDGIDGCAHYVDLGIRRRSDEPLIRNTIVEITPRRVDGPIDMDRTIASVAGRNRGIYSAELHGEADPRASGEYIATHVRRLEAMRRANLVKRSDDGSWRVGADHLARATRFETANRSQSPARVAVLSWKTLDELPHATGATWLDRTLVARTGNVVAATGFGADVEAALQRRRQWLIGQGLAREQGDGTVYARDLSKALERRELIQAGARIASETGLDQAEIRKGETVTGKYRRMLTLNSGRFALIERAHDFVLVPWRPVLDHAAGQNVSGVVGGESISWSIGIKRGLGR